MLHTFTLIRCEMMYGDFVWTSVLIGKASKPSHTYWPIGTSRWFWTWRTGGPSCKQQGHLSRTCPQKSTINSTNNISNYSNAGKAIDPNTNPILELEDHPNKPEEGWTQVTRKEEKPDSQNNRISNRSNSKSNIWNNQKSSSDNTRTNWNSNICTTSIITSITS